MYMRVYKLSNEATNRVSFLDEVDDVESDFSGESGLRMSEACTVTFEIVCSIFTMIGLSFGAWDMEIF